jgi:hypothetical protein
MTIFYLYPFILGIITGIFFLKIYQSIKKPNKTKKQQSKYLRRGLYINSYNINTAGVKTGSVDVQFEVGELEKTSNRSKVEVINLSTSSATYNKEGDDRDRIKSMINNSWVNSNEIEWIEDDLSQKRDEKLNELLN